MDILIRAADLAGLDLQAVGPDNFRKAFRTAMGARSLDDPQAYLELLAIDPRERRLLAGEAVVQESWLFRDPEAFAGLARLARTTREAIPSGLPLRLLSVPCATGEEPASMVAALAGAGLAPRQFQVDAADAHPAALAQARTGRFGPASLRGKANPGPHFRPQGQDFVLDPALLSRIRFIEADVLDPAFLKNEPPYAAVFCRHLLIYLAPEARVRLAATLKRLLGDSGALFTSPVEAAAFLALGLTPAGRQDAPQPSPLLAPPEASADRPDVRHQPLPTAPAPRASADLKAAPIAPAAQDEADRNSLERARGLADQGRLDEALALTREIIERDGPSACLHHLEGAALLALGREEEAEAALRRAVYLDPGHVEALSHLELLSRAKGRDDEAGLLAARVRRAGETRP